MAMFGSNAKESKTQVVDATAATNIGQGAVLEGNINTQGNVRIDGKLKGDVTSSSKVATGKQSFIEGCIYAKNAEIEGEVVGKLDIEGVLLLKGTSNIKGDIKAGKLVIESGAIFNGSCQMGTQASEPITLNTEDQQSSTV